MISAELVRAYYPDDTRDGTKAFYGWIRAHTGPSSVLLNLGAGPPTESPPRIFKGEVARVVGADIDPVVLNNPELDEARLIIDDRLPFDDARFDLIVSDFTFEHVDRPDAFLAEARRVLKPGGSLFFRTPNLYHYVALISYCTPHWFHELVANRARGLEAGAHAPWPTRYRMNTAPALRRLSRRAGFNSIEVRHFEPEPRYLFFHAWPFRAGVLYERLVNRYARLEGLRCALFGRMRR